MLDYIPEENRQFNPLNAPTYAVMNDQGARPEMPTLYLWLKTLLPTGEYVLVQPELKEIIKLLDTAQKPCFGVMRIVQKARRNDDNYAIELN